jgi:hypothetical protein
MSLFEFVCLANSRKMSARCVAGLRTDRGEWIRPVSALEHGVLTYLQRQLGDGGDPRHFDLLRVSFEKALPAPTQPENWLIDGSAWRLVRRPAPAELSGLLQRRLYTGEQLFGSCADRIAVAVYENKRAPESLLLVKPGQVRWLTALYSGEKRARVSFAMGRVSYNLSVTDPPIADLLKTMPAGQHTSREIGIAEAEEERMLFTLSLGEAFQGNYYKLVASVLIPPADWPRIG